LEAQEEWAKTQRYGRPYIRTIKDCISSINVSLKKTVDDAQRGDFGPLFIALGIMGTLLTLIFIVACSGGGTKSKA
jgi:hypothetical protein